MGLAVAASCLRLTIGAEGGRPALTEYQVKAAFLYNFAKFVEWPQASFKEAGAALVIGILGQDSFGEVLDRTVENKLINGRPIKVKRFGVDEDPGDCHLLFISRSEAERMGEVLSRLRGRSVLLVGETDGFLELGGMISFYLEDQRVRFTVNLDAAEGVRLKISSKLLGVAKVVRAK